MAKNTKQELKHWRYTFSLVLTQAELIALRAHLDRLSPKQYEGTYLKNWYAFQAKDTPLKWKRC